MRVEYDPEVDALYIRSRAGEVADSDEIRAGVLIDYDARCEVLGIELLSASKRTDNPREIAFAMPDVRRPA